MGGEVDFTHKSCKGNLLPNFETWFKEMLGDGQTSDNGGGDGLSIDRSSGSWSTSPRR